jgi:hypothetical protein
VGVAAAVRRGGADPSHAVGPPGVAEVRPAGVAKHLRSVARAEAVDLDDDQPGFGQFLRG